MKGLYFLALSLACLAGCSQSTEDTSSQALVAKIDPSNHEHAAPQNKFGFAEALEQPSLFGSQPAVQKLTTVDIKEPAADSSPDPKFEAARTAPQHQIAYSYGFGFRINKSKIAELQRAHTGLCQTMGAKCRILRISQANGDWDGYGEVKLEVAATEAGAFEQGLTAPATQLGGDLISSVRDGEDLSDTIIDSEARLQSRLALRDKLTAILRNNKGSVDELIKAEQALADVNEQIDTSRSKLEQYQNRIRYSDVRIEYQPEFGQTQLGFRRPVMTALRSIGTTLGTTIGALIYIITALIPISLLIIGLRWVLHRFGLRIRFWRKAPKIVEKLP